MQPAHLFASLNLLPDAALLADNGGTILFASESLEALLGLEAGALLGRPLPQWLASADPNRATPSPRSRDFVARDAAGPRRLSSVDGRTRVFEVSARDLSLEPGRGVLMLLRETQNRATSEPSSDNAALAEALRRNEERLRHATQAAQVGIFDHPAMPSPAPPPYWSPTLRAILGFDEECEADFEWFQARVHPEDVSMMQAAIGRAMGPGGDGSIDIEYRWLHPEKGYRWLLVRSVSQFMEVDRQSVPWRSLGAIIDVTERRAAEMERQLRAAILDATPDFVAICEPDGQLVYMNRAARAFMGLVESDGLEARVWHASHPPETVALLQNVAIPAATRLGSWSAETQFLRHDGQIIPMSQVVLAHRDAADKVAYLSMIARDLSKEKHLEEQFRQSQKMEAIGRLAGGVAHDFNNLLSVILGYTEMASQELPPDNTAQRALREIERAGERAAALTGQLLAFGRKQILKPRVLDINDVLSEFTPMVSRLVDESIDLHVIPSPVPANIRADPNQVQQVLLNLVVNARDAMPQGGVLTVEAFRLSLEESSTHELRAGIYTVIAVSDTGHGMDKETRDRIFEPFFTTKGPGAGTGLGLSTVFGIVQQSGGSIWLYSEPGRGTTFKIYFPCTDEPVDEPVLPPAVFHAPQSGVILFTEDDEQVRGMVANVLSRAGYQVLSAAHPAEALEVAGRHEGRIDLLITDVVMPGMTGTVLARELHRTRPELPVLFTSGYTENTIVHQGVLDDGVNFLAKPITPGRLLATIVEVLRPSDRSAG